MGSNRNLARNHLLDLMTNTLDEFCSCLENMGVVGLKDNELICLKQGILSQYQMRDCGIVAAQSSFSDLR